MLIQIVEDDFALSNGIRLALSQPEIDFSGQGSTGSTEQLSETSSRFDYSGY